ncbi:restriction endonuclease subunit S [uncultured Acetobacterium sp.]|uniref:restriction endonuclease subunit S n=1 Tax=uncultured Acetobacterium sp. TaxID=217139 RepID=UPI0025D2693B|nr:restriction endonuclease subunit S [uncultured Acetobacterium sp.]
MSFKVDFNQIYRFGDVCRVINGRAYKKTEFHDVGKYAVLRVGNFFSSDRWYYSDLELEEDKYCENGDLLFAWSASFGPKIWDGEKVIYHYHIWKLEPSELVNKFFLYYWLLYSREKMLSSMHGSVMGHLTKSSFENQQISLPQLLEQKNIAAILSSLDDKIELNRKINDNLEDQMQTIFGSVFYPELEAGNKVSLGDYLYIKGRIGWKGLKKDEYLDDSGFRIINGESLTVKGIDWNKAGYISEERYAESPEIMLQEGDILISKDGTIGKIGYVNILDKPTAVASGIFVVRNLKPDEVSTVFIYCLFKSVYFNHFIASRTEGSVIPHLYQKDFVTLEIPLLSEEQLRFFNESVTSLFELYFSNNTENIRLASLRDTLLPKLMSGELDVSEINLIVR